MAEAIGLAASIVGIASAGVSVVSTLTKFGISFRGSNDKINSLAGRVSLTASILSDIATTVEQNASGFKKVEFWKTWRKVLLSCEDSYGKLERALLKARRSGTSKSKPGNDGVSVWGKLVWALGGETEMQDLETSLERCCQQVMMMQQAVQMSVLSLIAQRQKLSSDEIEDQRDLMSKLQWLLSTLSEAGILPAGNIKSKTVILVDESPPELPNDTAAEELHRGFDPEDNGNEAPPLTRGFGAGSPSVGLNSFAVHAVLPQPKRRPGSPKANSKVPAWQPDAKEEVKPEQKEHFFEAYYIIPRSFPRTQPRGQIQLTKPVGDDYMIICLDTKLDYHKDPNLRNALRRAKRAHGWVTPSIINDFPRNVQEAALSLANHRKRHANGLAWSLVEGVELRCLEDSMFRRSSLKSGFLIVFRGTGFTPASSPPPTSILKGSANNQRGKHTPSWSTADEKTPVMSQSTQFPPPASPSSPSVSFESVKKQKHKRRRSSRSYHIEEHLPSYRDEDLLPGARPFFTPYVDMTAKAAAYQAGKLDGDLGRSADYNSHHHTARRKAVVSYERRESIEDVHLEEGGFIDEPEETFLEGDSVKTEGLKSAEAEEHTDQEDFDRPVERAPVAQSSQKSNESGSNDEAVDIKKNPTLFETNTATQDDVKGKVVSKGKKAKARVEFENTALLKSERPVTRPLPGPVLYDPARSKLLPSPKSPFVLRTRPPSSHRRVSSAPFISSISAPGSPLPAVPQPPQSHSAWASYYALPVPDSRPLSERFARRPSSSSPAFGSYTTPLPYTMAPPPPPIWTASSQPSNSIHRPVTPPTPGDNNAYFGEELRQEESYEDDAAGSPPALTARMLMLKRQHRRHRRQVGSSRSTRPSESQDLLDDSKSATTRTQRKGSNGNEEYEDVTIEAANRASIKVGDDAEANSSLQQTAQDPLRSRPVIVDERVPHKRQSVSSGKQPTRQHRKERIVIVERIDGVAAAPRRTNSYHVMDRPDSTDLFQDSMLEQSIPIEQAIDSEVSRRQGQARIHELEKTNKKYTEERYSKGQDRNPRFAQIAKAGVGTAAVSGVLEHFRSKSRTRSEERFRSQSRLRIGAEIASSGLTGAAAAELYETRKAEEARETQGERATRERRTRRASSADTYSDPGVDPTLGLVSYGTEPVSVQSTISDNGYGYDARDRSRSRSRVKDIAGATVSPGAAAVAIDQYKKRKERKDAEYERKAEEHAEEKAERDSDFEPTISDFSSASGDEDEDSTLVEEHKENGDGEELHLTQSEAETMMMNFLATFTTV